MTQIKKGANQGILNVILFCLGLLSSASQTIKVSSFGISDATASIKKAMKSEFDTVLIDKITNPWLVGPLRFKNIKNKVVILEDGVVIEAKIGSFPNTNDVLIEFMNSENVTIIGNNAELVMNKKEYIKGEWRHGISLRGSKNIRISNLTIRDSGGDGIYIAGSDKNIYSENIQITGIKSVNNKRQGISIISAKNVQLTECFFEKTKGTLPSAGLDIEPNRPEDVVIGISVSNCIFKNNSGSGILLALGKLNTSSHPISVVFNNCIVKNNNFPDNPKFGAEIVLKANKDSPVKGVLTFNNCLISDASRGFLYSRKRADAYSVAFIDCMVDNVGNSRTNSLITLEVPDYNSLTGPLGGIEFKNLYVKNMKPSFFMTVRGSKKGTLSGLHNIKGQITIEGGVKEGFVNYINYNNSLNKKVDLRLINN